VGLHSLGWQRLGILEGSTKVPFKSPGERKEQQPAGCHKAFGEKGRKEKGGTFSLIASLKKCKGKVPHIVQRGGEKGPLCRETRCSQVRSMGGNSEGRGR